MGCHCSKATEEADTTNKPAKAHNLSDPSAAGTDLTDPSNPFQAPLDEIRSEERPYQHLSEITHFDVDTLRRLHAIFEEISGSKIDDGIIDAAELTSAMGLKTAGLLARTLFKIFDITETKKINFRTWVTTLSALSLNATLEEKIRFSFSLYDMNGDGKIDIHELRSLLEEAVRENVLNLTDAEVKQWCDFTLSQVDKDGNGTVEYAEYREMVKASHKFLESFTLDIDLLCGSFHANMANGTYKMLAGKRFKNMTTEEEAAKTAQFRERNQKLQRADSAMTLSPQTNTHALQQHNGAANGHPTTVNGSPKLSPAFTRQLSAPVASSPLATSTDPFTQPHNVPQVIVTAAEPVSNPVQLDDITLQQHEEA